jgi:hypothetical protein
LFADAPMLYDVVLMNPPFGGKEGKDAQTRFAYKTSATQVLFLQHVINSLKPGGRCGIVLDEGVLFRTNETAFVQTKRKLLDDCDLWCIVSLPPGTFVNAGAGVKAIPLFFTKRRATESIWYYDLSDVKVGKKTPSHWPISKSSSACCPNAPTVTAVGQSPDKKSRVNTSTSRQLTRMPRTMKIPARPRNSWL